MKQYHSHAYHEYFEGYTEEQVIDDNGKIKINRIYTGDYYQPEQSAEQEKRHRKIIALLFMAAICIFVISGFQKTDINRQTGVALFEAAAFFLMFLFSRPLFYYLFSKRPYTVRIYRIVTQKFLSYAKWVYGCCWMSTFSMIVYIVYFLFAGLKLEVFKTVICVMGNIISGGLFFLIVKLESNIPYVKKDGNQIRPRDGVDIRY